LLAGQIGRGYASAVTYSRDAEIANPYRFKSREKVFESGHKRVETIAEVVQEETGAMLDGRRALDYGCGVGRLAIPLAERCEHVYGLDISRPTLEIAAANAQEHEVENVQWLEPEALSGLAGQYDFAITVHVLQHIRRRQGEQVLRQLVRGLREDGVGWIGLVLRPPHPLRSVLRYSWRARDVDRPQRKSGIYRPALDALRIWDLSYYYMMRCSYALNRLGRLLADEGVENWHVRFNAGETPRAFDAATLIFRKG
jgi:SAM-dependent methyltransferase